MTEYKLPPDIFWGKPTVDKLFSRAAKNYYCHKWWGALKDTPVEWLLLEKMKTASTKLMVECFRTSDYVKLVLLHVFIVREKEEKRVRISLIFTHCMYKMVVASWFEKLSRCVFFLIERLLWLQKQVSTAQVISDLSLPFLDEFMVSIASFKS